MMHNCVSLGFILFILDSPLFMRFNYPEVNTTIHSTYSMIEPTRNIYKEGCLTDVCTPGGHLYALGTASFESFFLPRIRNLDCVSRDETSASLSLTELDYINPDDCTDHTTNQLVIGSEEQFCSVSSTVGR